MNAQDEVKLLLVYVLRNEHKLILHSQVCFKYIKRCFFFFLPRVHGNSKTHLPRLSVVALFMHCYCFVQTGNFASKDEIRRAPFIIKSYENFLIENFLNQQKRQHMKYSVVNKVDLCAWPLDVIYFTFTSEIDVCVYFYLIFSIICYDELWCEILESFKLKQNKRENIGLCVSVALTRRWIEISYVVRLFNLPICVNERKMKNVNISKESKEKKRPKPFSTKTRSTQIGEERIENVGELDTRFSQWAESSFLGIVQCCFHVFAFTLPCTFAQLLLLLLFAISSSLTSWKSIDFLVYWCASPFVSFFVLSLSLLFFASM